MKAVHSSMMHLVSTTFDSQGQGCLVHNANAGVAQMTACIDSCRQLVVPRKRIHDKLAHTYTWADALLSLLLSHAPNNQTAGTITGARISRASQLPS